MSVNPFLPNPESFTKGGLKTNFWSEVKNPRFEMWNFNKEGADVSTFVMFDLLPEGENESFRATWKVCAKWHNVPSKDGETPVDIEGEDTAGAYLVKSPESRNKRDGLAPMDATGEWYHFLQTLSQIVDLAETFPSGDESIEPFGNIYAYWELIPREPFESKGKTITPPPNLCITKLKVGFDGEEIGDGDSEPEAAGSMVKGSKSPARKPTKKETEAQMAGEYIAAAVESGPKAVTAIAMEAMREGGDLARIVPAHIGKSDFMKSEAWFSYDPDTMEASSLG